MPNIYDGLDPRNIPAYPIGEAAQYLRIPVNTLRSWFRDHSYSTDRGKRSFTPLLELPDLRKGELSFTNLVEAHVLRAIRLDHRIRLDKVRIALEYINHELRMPHPLAWNKFKTDGVELFIEHYGELIAASKAGQITMRAALEGHLKRIEPDKTGLAARLFPFTRARDEDAPKVVVIDPRISFGRPVLVNTGIPTAMLAERYKAGESIGNLAEDYGCDRLQVEEAIRCELPLVA